MSTRPLLEGKNLPLAHIEVKVARISPKVAHNQVKVARIHLKVAHISNKVAHN